MPLEALGAPLGDSGALGSALGVPLGALGAEGVGRKEDGGGGREKGGDIHYDLPKS